MYYFTIVPGKNDPPPTRLKMYKLSITIYEDWLLLNKRYFEKIVNDLILRRRYTCINHCLHRLTQLKVEFYISNNVSYLSNFGYDDLV